MGLNNMREQCEDCPLKTGQIPVIDRGLELTTKRICAVEIRCEDLRKETFPAISSKVGWKVFWPVVVIFVGITSGMITFISSSNASYQRDHTEIHRELNSEIKTMNHNIYQEIRTISGDIKAIKVKMSSQKRAK